METQDKLIGQQIRYYRTLKQKTGAELAASLGLSYNQLQKYESGANKVSASRLKEISGLLDVPVALFYDEALATNDYLKDVLNVKLALDKLSVRDRQIIIELANTMVKGIGDGRGNGKEAKRDG